MHYYHQRFKSIIEYIDKNLEQPISIRTLSEISCFSEYHFHRQFSAYLGQPIKKYIQLKRLNKAAYQLIFRQHLSISEISFQATYENSESFSRAFKKAFGQSPSDYKKCPQSKPWQDVQTETRKLKERQEHMLKNENQSNEFNAISIVKFPETKLAVYQHQGPANQIMSSVQHFIKWRKLNNLPPSKSKTYNLIYSDPSNTPEDEFKFDICAQVKHDIEDNEFDVINKTIPEGRCAKYRHIGSDRFLDESMNFLYGTWLPESGETLRDYPCILERVKMYPDVAESEAIIDIYLPIE
ncbi:MAG: AraC family transcriptional regulator [Colwelliaceae bacterium]|nr:AraC family transcriptional regulator [Colwelliaceae bacterium]